MNKDKCTRISYSTIANGHGFITSQGNHVGDNLTFRTIANGTGSYPVLSSNGFDDNGHPSQMDVFHWYIAGNFGTYSANVTAYSQRPALFKASEIITRVMVRHEI